MKIYGWNNIIWDLLPHNRVWGCGIRFIADTSLVMSWWLLNLGWQAQGGLLYLFIMTKYLLCFILCIWNFSLKRKEAHFGPTLVLMTDVAGSPHPLGAGLLRGSYLLTFVPFQVQPFSCSLHSSQVFLAEFLLLFSYIISLFYFWAPVHAFSNYSQQRETWNSHMLPLNILLLKGQTEIAQRADSAARKASGERFLPYFSLK